MPQGADGDGLEQRRGLDTESLSKASRAELLLSSSAGDEAVEEEDVAEGSLARAGISGCGRALAGWRSVLVPAGSSPWPCHGYCC